MNPERVMHRYDSTQSYCERCLATVKAIGDGFVSPLCAGQPIVVHDQREAPDLELARNLFKQSFAAQDSQSAFEAFELFIRALVRDERV